MEDGETSPRELIADEIVLAAEEPTPMETEDIRNLKKDSSGSEQDKLTEKQKCKDNEGDDDEDDVLTELVTVASKSNENEKDSNEGSEYSCLHYFRIRKMYFFTQFHRQQTSEAKKMLSYVSGSVENLRQTTFCSK